jgi:phospholipase C
MLSGYVNPIHTVFIVINNNFTFWHYYGYFNKANEDAK